MYSFKVVGNEFRISGEQTFMELAEEQRQQAIAKGVLNIGFANDQPTTQNERGVTTVSHAIEGNTIKPVKTARQIAGTFFGLNSALYYLEEPNPSVAITHMRVDEDDWRFTLGAKLKDAYVEKLIGLSRSEKNDLQTAISDNTYAIARILEPTQYPADSKGIFEHRFLADIYDAGDVHISCPGAATGLDPGNNWRPGTDQRLEPHNLDRSGQQLMLLGGLAVLSQHSIK